MKNIMKVSKFYEIFMQNTVLYQVFYIIKKSEFKSYFYSFELIKKLMKSKNDPLIISEIIEQFNMEKEGFSYKNKIIIETMLKEIKDMVKKKENALFEFDRFSKSQFMKAHFINFNYENFLEFENRNFFLFYSTEFENYLFRCFKYIFKKIPVLLGDLKITINDLLSKKDLIKKDGMLSKDKPLGENIIDLLIAEKAEKRIHDKFYENYNEIFDFASNKLGIKHEITSEHLIILNLLKQIRNVYVHGDGKLNHIHMKKINKYYKKFPQENLGAKFSIESKFVEYANDMYIAVALLFDKALIKAYPKLLTDIDVSIGYPVK